MQIESNKNKTSFGAVNFLRTSDNLVAGVVFLENKIPSMADDLVYIRSSKLGRSDTAKRLTALVRSGRTDIAEQIQAGLLKILGRESDLITHYDNKTRFWVSEQNRLVTIPRYFKLFKGNIAERIKGSPRPVRQTSDMIQFGDNITFRILDLN